MAIAFVHLSDIHFGQERGGVVVVHDDAKARLIEDLAKVPEDLRTVLQPAIEDSRRGH